MNERKVQKVISVSPDLPKKEVAETLNKIFAEHDSILEAAMPNGKLIVFALSKKDRFHTLDKAATNLSLLRKIYNDREILENPELGKEFNEIAQHLKEINSIMEKRKQAFKKKRIKPKNENNAKQEKTEGEE